MGWQRLPGRIEGREDSFGCADSSGRRLFGGIAAVLGFLTILVIMRFDKPIIQTQEEVNEAEHVVSATLFDSLSNIMTVVTLRLEQSMENGLAGKIHRLLHPFRRNAVINEWKWFVADTLVAMIYCIIISGRTRS